MTVKYIIIHWTGGNYRPCQQDLNSYQMLIDGYGKIYNGKPVGQSASTGGMNSITYNISCCGGLSYTPMTNIQMEAMFDLTARKLLEYGLSVDKVYTHAEIGQMVKNKTITKLLPYNNYLPQNLGKIDLTKIPYDTKGQANGDFIRGKIKWYYNKLVAQR